jgi:hypothetical protein
MEKTILEGRGRDVIGGSLEVWQDGVAKAPATCERRLRFMTEDHHLVRYFVVRELPRVGRPIQPSSIAEELNLPAERVRQVLEDLETHLFFLVRNDEGAVSWAFPVTVDRTPHRLTFASGERLSGA